MGTTENRFDLIRLVFASMVFLYHTVVLGSVDPFGTFETQLAVLAELSIQGFFIVSGALVMGSFERSKTLADYASKRVRRLYPAYAVVILAPVLVAILLAGDLMAILRYLGANLVFLNFLEPTLPGMFEDQRFTEVNGALWTLKIEVMFYIVLPAIAWGLSKLGRYWWAGILGLMFAAFVWRDTMLAIDHTYSAQFARQLPGQMMYFAAGIALWRMWDVARAQAIPLLAIGILILALSLLVPALESLRVLGLTGIIAGIAFIPGPALNVAAWGDVSYGVYIVHFPIVQGLVAAGVFATIGFWSGLVVSIMLVFATSYLLWWWVEKPALRRDSHYLRVSGERMKA